MGTLWNSLWSIFLLVMVRALDVEFPEEDSVLVLTEKNFEVAIKSHPFILVEFYAPWCGHCKQFAPEYAGAAKLLKQANPPIPLAKVDATAELRLVEEYGVRGFPTIRLFIDGRDQEYTGGRTEQSIVTWVLKKAGPPAIQLTNVASAEAFQKENRLAVVGFFEEATSRVAFEQAARQVEDVMFAYTTSADVVSSFGVAAPSLKMFFPHDEKVSTFSGNLQSAEDIEKFVKAYRHPMVIDFTGETAPDLFADGRSILFVFRDKDEKGEAAEKAVRKVAASLDRRLLVSVAGSSEPMDQRLMDYVSVEPLELPSIRIVTNPSTTMAKYRLEGELSEDAILAFVRDFEAGKLKQFLQTQPAPTSQTGPVHVLVGSTFEAVVKDPTKDVLVKFYAPWCGHCKKLEPVYASVAKKLEGISSLVIAKIDATANDVEGVDIEGFPAIKFWRADNKDEPLTYDADRDIDSFIAWLEEKASRPFTRDQVHTEL